MRPGIGWREWWRPIFVSDSDRETRLPTATVSGFRFHYADDDFADPWIPHDTIFLQPFLYGDTEAYRGWVPTLARHLRVIRMDRRGVGQSDKPGRGDDISLNLIVSDFANFLDHVGIEAVHLVGHGFGGVFMLLFASEYPKRAKSLTLCSTPLRPGESVQARFRGNAQGQNPAAAMERTGSWLWSRAAFLRDAPAGGSCEEILHWLYHYERAGQVPAHMLAALAEIAQSDLNLVERLARVTVPTLLLSPSEADVAPLADQAIMLDGIPDCRQVIFEGEDQRVAWFQPDRCAAEVMSFIRSLGSGAA